MASDLTPDRAHDGVTERTMRARPRALGLLALEEPHLHAGQLHDIVVVQATRLRSDRHTVDLREVILLAAVDVDDEVAFGAARDGRDLYSRAAQRGQRLRQLQLTACE